MPGTIDDDKSKPLLYNLRRNASVGRGFADQATVESAATSLMLNRIHMLNHHK